MSVSCGSVSCKSVSCIVVSGKSELCDCELCELELYEYELEWCGGEQYECGWGECDWCGRVATEATKEKVKEEAGMYLGKTSTPHRDVGNKNLTQRCGKNGL